MEKLGTTAAKSTLSRLQVDDAQRDAAAPVARKDDLRVQDLLDLARALDVSPLALIVPLSGNVKIGVGDHALSMSARIFRLWLLGQRPLEGQKADSYYDNIPGLEPQAEEMHELEALVRDAVWAAYDEDVLYAESLTRRRDLERRFRLVMDRLEFEARQRDAAGHEQYEQRRADAARRAARTAGTETREE